ncbi:hypothetical protein ACFSQP_10520 [Bizionia sediminis]|uniref:Uncharacterized protein n=1 Tax=Bizionia sediminis TaxID=1737064 RepID=A0ABW5KWE8_9FLAO
MKNWVPFVIPKYEESHKLVKQRKNENKKTRHHLSFRSMRNHIPNIVTNHKKTQHHLSFRSMRNPMPSVIPKHEKLGAICHSEA